MAHPPPSTLNRLIGQNLSALRKARGISQGALARELTGRGAPFQQQTLLRAEKGSRPLKFDEAVVIAETLGVPVTELLKANAARVALTQQLSRTQDTLSRLAVRQAELLEELAAVERDIEHAEVLEREALEQLATLDDERED